jgi:hypothetical protein
MSVMLMLGRGRLVVAQWRHVLIIDDARAK